MKHGKILQLQELELLYPLSILKERTDVILNEEDEPRQVILNEEDEEEMETEEEEEMAEIDKIELRKKWKQEWETKVRLCDKQNKKYIKHQNELIQIQVQKQQWRLEFEQQQEENMIVLDECSRQTFYQNCTENMLFKRNHSSKIRSNCIDLLTNSNISMNSILNYLDLVCHISIYISYMVDRATFFTNCSQYPVRNLSKSNQFSNSNILNQTFIQSLIYLRKLLNKTIQQTSFDTKRLSLILHDKKLQQIYLSPHMVERFRCMNSVYHFLSLSCECCNLYNTCFACSPIVTEQDYWEFREFQPIYKKTNKFDYRLDCFSSNPQLSWEFIADNSWINDIHFEMVSFNLFEKDTNLRSCILLQELESLQIDLLFNRMIDIV